MFENILKPSQKLTLLDRLDPVSQGAATVNGAWLNGSDYNQYLILLEIGVMAGGATLDFKLQQATSSGGAGAKDITNSAITTLTQAGGNGSQIVIVEFNPAAAFDRDNSFEHWRWTLTEGVAASLVGVQVFGLDPKFGPGSQPVGVAQTVSVF